MSLSPISSPISPISKQLLGTTATTGKLDPEVIKKITNQYVLDKISGIQLFSEKGQRMITANGDEIIAYPDGRIEPYAEKFKSVKNKAQEENK